MDKQVAHKIHEFFGSYRLRQYSKGQVLILNGEDTDYVYHLEKGRVKQCDITYRGDEIVLNVFKPPAFFPMSLAINKTANPFIYEAETDIEVRQAPANEAVEFIKNNPDVMLDLLRRVFIGADGIMERMARLMSGNAKGRLMYEILLSCRRFGKDNNDGSWTLQLTESELAARAGLSRETVSREMQHFKEQKLLELTGGQILVNDLNKFEENLGKVI